MGFVVDKMALEQIFSDYFGYPCKFSFQRLLYTRHLSSGAGKIGQLVADVPSGFSLIPHQETKEKLRLIFSLRMLGASARIANGCSLL
jgi:hypothetical protein